MTYNGRIHNGVVVLDDGTKLAEGTRVRVAPVAPVEAVEAVEQPDSETQGGRAKLKALAGVIDDLPSDLARNHDHYLHGHPKVIGHPKQ